MTLEQTTNLTKNCEKGVTIIYLPDQKKWGVQYPEEKASFHTTFSEVISTLTK